MSFELEINDVRRRDGEMAITGIITAGAYAGPEWVEMKTMDGRTLRTVVTHHSMFGIDQWPIEPDHAGTLVILVPEPRQPLVVDMSQPLMGIGFRLSVESRVDIGESVRDPRFWAGYLSSCIEADEFFTVSADEMDEFHEATIHARWHDGAWPFLRVPLGGERYLEVEWAADAEYQTRIWAGIDAGTKLILGYDSGHFSLPAIRFAEFRAIARNAAAPHLALLAFPMCGEESYSADDRAFLQELVQELPGLRRAKAAEATDVLIEARTLEESRWTNDPRWGWINDSPISQRNPDGLMNWNDDDDFARLRTFFAQLGA